MTRERSGRRRKTEQKSKSVPVAAAIDDLIRHLGIGKVMGEYSVITSWPDVVGEQIARVTKADRIENGILYVAVTSAPWRAELSMKRREIITRVNTALGKEIVKDIRFR